jgi:hypothetical protein
MSGHRFFLGWQVGVSTSCVALSISILQARWLKRNDSRIVNRPSAKSAHAVPNHTSVPAAGLGAMSFKNAIEKPKTAEPNVNTALSNVRAPSRAASISCSRCFRYCSCSFCGASDSSSPIFAIVSTLGVVLCPLLKYRERASSGRFAQTAQRTVFDTSPQESKVGYSWPPCWRSTAANSSQPPPPESSALPPSQRATKGNEGAAARGNGINNLGCVFKGAAA